MKTSIILFNEMCRGSSVPRLLRSAAQWHYGSSAMPFAHFLGFLTMILRGVKQFQALHSVPQCLGAWGVEAEGKVLSILPCLSWKLFLPQEVLSPNRPSLVHYCSEFHLMLILKPIRGRKLRFTSLEAHKHLNEYSGWNFWIRATGTSYEMVRSLDSQDDIR